MRLTECSTAEEVRQLARRVAHKRAELFRQPESEPEPAPLAVVAEPEPEPEPAPDPVPVVILPRTVRQQHMEIVRAVARVYSVASVEAILGPRRSASLTWPRHLSFWLIFKLLQLPLSVIGRRLNRDHSTVFHGIRRVEAEIAAGSPRGTLALTLLEQFKASP